MTEWAEAWDEIDYKPQEFTKAGDSVLVSVLYDGRGKGSGVRFEEIVRRLGESAGRVSPVDFAAR